MGRPCNDGCNPETDDTTIDCDGNYISTDCIITEAISYLDIDKDSSLTLLIEKLVDRVRNLTNSVGSSWSLPEYADDVSAGVDGLPLGNAYVTPTGEVRIRKQ